MISAEERTIISAEVTRRIMSQLRTFIPEQDERYEFQMAPTGDRPGIILHFKSNSKPWADGLENEIREKIPLLVAAAGPGLEAQERTNLYDGYLAWVVRPRSENRYLSAIGMNKAEIRNAVQNLHRGRIAARLGDQLKKFPRGRAISAQVKDPVSMGWATLPVDWEQQKDTIPHGPLETEHSTE